ncbi:hypothetical protein HEP87_52830 [Streptomyces sp. S1D4-11]|nr:hypothetical protein [Streptomyces sp. S1D4-11]QIZ00820.1 hypothetical protein HEP87_52830 [Streptomyces sp. S1D4-11]
MARASRTKGLMSRVDPGRFACRVLAADLADEWALYCEAMAVREPERSDGAVRDFAAFTDSWLARHRIAPETVRLAGAGVDLTEIVLAWEHELRRAHPHPSQQG